MEHPKRSTLKERAPEWFRAFGMHAALVRLTDAIHAGEVPLGSDAVAAWLRSAPDSWIVGANDLLDQMDSPLPNVPANEVGDTWTAGEAGLILLALLVDCEGHGPEVIEDDAAMSECSGNLRLLLLYEMARRAGVMAYEARGPLLWGGDLDEAIQVRGDSAEDPVPRVNAWLHRVRTQN